MNKIQIITDVVNDVLNNIPSFDNLTYDKNMSDDISNLTAEDILAFVKDNNITDYYFGLDNDTNSGDFPCICYTEKTPYSDKMIQKRKKSYIDHTIWKNVYDTMKNNGFKNISITSLDIVKKYGSLTISMIIDKYGKDDLIQYLSLRFV